MALTHGMKPRIFENICSHFNAKKSLKAEKAFDPSTSGLWAQHTSAAPLCFQPLQKRLDLTIHGLGGQCLRPLGLFEINMTNTN